MRSGTTSIVPAQYMREEMLTPSPPPNWGQSSVANFQTQRDEPEYKDEVRRTKSLSAWGWQGIVSIGLIDESLVAPSDVLVPSLVFPIPCSRGC